MSVSLVDTMRTLLWGCLLHLRFQLHVSRLLSPGVRLVCIRSFFSSKDYIPIAGYPETVELEEDLLPVECVGEPECPRNVQSFFDLSGLIYIPVEKLDVNVKGTARIIKEGMERVDRLLAERDLRVQDNAIVDEYWRKHLSGKKFTHDIRRDQLLSLPEDVREIEVAKEMEKLWQERRYKRERGKREKENKRRRSSSGACHKLKTWRQ